MIPQRLFAKYLNDHLALATAEVELFERAVNGFEQTPWVDDLRHLATESAEDRAWFVQTMHMLEVTPSRMKQATAKLAERLGRLRPNGSLIRRTRLTDLMELEALRVVLAAKINGLQVLRAAALRDDRLDTITLEMMLERAQAQADRLYRLHLQVANELTQAA